jgi:hypothetical protein
MKLAKECRKRYMKLKEYELIFFMCMLESFSVLSVVFLKGLWFWSVLMLEVDL